MTGLLLPKQQHLERMKVSPQGANAVTVCSSCGKCQCGCGKGQGACSCKACSRKDDLLS
jgi:hypothetical protein